MNMFQSIRWYAETTAQPLCGMVNYHALGDGELILLLPCAMWVTLSYDCLILFNCLGPLYDKATCSINTIYNQIYEMVHSP